MGWRCCVECGRRGGEGVGGGCGDVEWWSGERVEVGAVEMLRWGGGGWWGGGEVERWRGGEVE